MNQDLTIAVIIDGEGVWNFWKKSFHKFTGSENYGKLVYSISKVNGTEKYGKFFSKIGISFFNKIPVENILEIGKWSASKINIHDYNYILFTGSSLEKIKALSLESAKPVIFFAFINNQKIISPELAFYKSKKYLCAALLIYYKNQFRVVESGKYRWYRHKLKKTYQLLAEDASNWLKKVRLIEDFTKLEVIACNQSNLGIDLISKIQFRLRYVSYKIDHFIKLLFTREEWNTAIVNKPISDFIKDPSLPIQQWLTKPHNGIKADPFLMQSKGKTIVYYESLSFNDTKGSITKFENNIESNFLVLAHHLSYPYIVSHYDKTYLIPENSDSNKLVAYILSDDGASIVDQITLIEGMAVVDGSIIHYNDKWWLFCTLKNDQPDMKLHIFYAEQFRGPYLPHKMNPVLTDISGARPGGSMFIKENKLYRPAQDSSYSYGDQIKIKQVVKITPTEFEERTINSITPKILNQYRTGLHTLSGNENLSVIDAKRIVWRINKKIFGKRD